MSQPNFEQFLEKAIKDVRFIQGLNNELARMSATNRLLGFLEGGLEGYRLQEEKS